MMWLVYVATKGSGTAGQINCAVSAVHNVVAFVYMAIRGHYFKHSERGNVVTRTIEANNCIHAGARTRDSWCCSD